MRVRLCAYDVSMVAVDTHCGGRLEEDGGEHTHSSQRGIETERTGGVMKKQRGNSDVETKRDASACACACVSDSVKISQSISHVFLFSHMHTLTQ